MDRKRLFTLLLCFWCIGALAQPHSVVSASGASFQNSSGCISYTIGECVTSTLITSQGILTQGFQQWFPKTPGVPVVNRPGIRISVFPNPVSDLLILQVEEYQGFDFILYDITGGLIARGPFLGERTEIDFTALAPSMYILKVKDNKEEVRLFQIVKH